MYTEDYNKNAAETPTSAPEPPGKRRVLVLGHTVAGCLLATLLDASGVETTVAPTEGGGCLEPRLPATVGRAEPLDGLDSNRLGVRVQNDDGETAYYDLVVDATGDRLDGRDRPRVAVVSPVAGESVRATAVGLGAVAALVDALCASESVTLALERYRRRRETLRGSI